MIFNTILMISTGVAAVAAATNFGMFTSTDINQVRNELGGVPAMRLFFFEIDANGFVDKYSYQAISECHSAGMQPILTLEPINVDLTALSSTTFQNIANTIAGFSTQNVIIRFGHEMNGHWYSWGSKPEPYRNAFRSLAMAIKAVAPDAKMLWAPNIEYKDLGNSYNDFWPGEDVVQIVGLSIYNNKYDRFYNLQLNLKSRIAGVGANGNDFYQQFAEKYNKDFMIAESSAGTCFDCSEADEIAWKRSWWNQIYAPDIQTTYPRLIGVVWFEITKENLNFGIFDRPAAVYNAFLSDVRDRLQLSKGAPGSASSNISSARKTVANSLPIQLAALLIVTCYAAVINMF